MLDYQYRRKAYAILLKQTSVPSSTTSFFTWLIQLLKRNA